MEPDERARRAQHLCDCLEADVASENAPDVLTWAPAWPITDSAGADFLIALSAWEREPTTEALERTKVAYRHVMGAWRVASADFERERQETGR